MECGGEELAGRIVGGNGRVLVVKKGRAERVED